MGQIKRKKTKGEKIETVLKSKKQFEQEGGSDRLQIFR